MIEDIVPAEEKTVQFSVLPPLKSGETLVAHIEVGSLPPARAKEYLDSIRNDFVSSYPENNIVVAGMRDGKRSLELSKT